MNARHVIMVGFSFVLCAALWADTETAAAATWPTNLYPVGESLVFEAIAIGVIPVGTVFMETTTGTFENTPTFVFNGRCVGRVAFYSADVRVSSHLSVGSGQSLFHCIEQYGTERRGRRLHFDWESNIVRYVRLQRDNTTYKLRRAVAISNDVFDVYGCAFAARRLFTNLAVGATAEVKLIEAERVFDISVSVVERAPLTVPGIGTFDAARLVFTPLNLKKKEVFKGLLNLDRDINVWIDSSTRTPLYLCSKVPFGFLRPTVEVRLTQWKTVPGFEPTLLKTNVFLPQAFGTPSCQ